VRTLWEIVALKQPSAAVGFWASWPARNGAGDAERGYIVSDRVLPKLLSGANEDRDTAPAALFDRLRADFDRERTLIREEFERSIPEPRSERSRRILWESFLIDAYGWRATSRLLEDPAVRAAFVYLPGLDILRGRLNAGRSRRTEERLEDDRALEGYVRWLDRLVGGAMALTSTRSVLLVADPGREAAPETEGFLVAEGSGVSGGCVGPPIGDLDVAPLALQLLGYPRSAEMTGRIPESCVAPAVTTAIVDTFGRRAVSDSPGSSDYDPEMVERLRSLGYVE
jgi:hypothetical protein